MEEEDRLSQRSLPRKSSIWAEFWQVGFQQAWVRVGNSPKEKCEQRFRAGESGTCSENSECSRWTDAYDIWCKLFLYIYISNKETKGMPDSAFHCLCQGRLPREAVHSALFLMQALWTMIGWLVFFFSFFFKDSSCAYHLLGHHQSMSGFSPVTSP